MKRFNLSPAIHGKLDHNIIIWYFSVIWIIFRCSGISTGFIKFPEKFLECKGVEAFLHENYFSNYVSYTRYDFNYFELGIFTEFNAAAKCSFIQTQNAEFFWKEFRGELLSFLCNFISNSLVFHKHRWKHLNMFRDTWEEFRTFA